MIPEFQTLMLPILKLATDGQIHTVQETINVLAKQLNLTEDDLNEWLPSGNQKRFYNYVYWAKAHLKMAGALENKARGQFQITERGMDILKENPSSVNIKYLINKYGEYRNLLAKNKISFSLDDELEISSVRIISSHGIVKSDLTPDETMGQAYLNIRQSLEVEILEVLKSVNPSFFERIVVELLVKMGYGGSIQDAGKAIGRSNDGGIDGIIKEDKLGLDVIYIQAKRWETVVGRPEIQKFVGALAGQRAKKGVFITTSHYTKEAIEYASQMDTKIVLINGEKLSQLMIDYNLGVSVQNTYEIKKIDSDYFEEE
jgi:restriction system protein